MGLRIPDSDYDVRFIYTDPAASYLTVHPARDVIEEPVNAELDVSGWDLRKTLGLLAKSNPPLLEWLDSPIIYRQDTGFAERFRAPAKEWFNPRACRHHYANMTRDNHREHMHGETVKLKKISTSCARSWPANGWMAAWGRCPCAWRSCWTPWCKTRRCARRWIGFWR